MNFDTLFQKLYRKYYRIRHGDPRVYWSSVRGRHRGKVGFVVGNGPSLKFDDLTRLRHQISIASNKIYLAYPETSWRPTYVTVTDELVWSGIKRGLHEHFDQVIVPRALDLRHCRCRLRTYSYTGVVTNYCAADEVPKFAKDFSQGIYGGHSVTYDNLQLAVHLGLDPIYLIGCDHYYAGERKGRDGAPVKASSSQNHFVKNYRSPGEIVHAAPIDKMNWAYQHAAEYAKRSGVRIFNATRGGHLEAFPRADLDQVLNEISGNAT